jgi:pSer/pThr/pTyr-binding forkhead associated (FHA) protein
VCDPSAQFCKFCGAPVGDAAPSTQQDPRSPETSQTSQVTSQITVQPMSAMPETPPVDRAQYQNFQAMSAISSSQNTMERAPESPTISPPAPTHSPRAQSVQIAQVQAPVAPPAPSARATSSPARATQSIGRLVIIARDGGEGPAFPLGDVTDIGRSDGHVLVAEDRFISPRHARISRRGKELFLRDLGSTNGIYLRIPAAASSASASTPTAPIEVTLHDQDLFLVGQQVLRFEVVRDAEEGFGAASQHGTLLFGTPASPRYARLSQRTVEGVTRDVFYIRKAETVLGRESGDIVFTDDPFLSRRHAALRYEAATNRFSVVDLGSSNGSFLQIREEVRLKDGDHFRVGQQLFRVDFEGAGARA